MWPLPVEVAAARALRTLRGRARSRRLVRELAPDAGVEQLVVDLPRCGSASRLRRKTFLPVPVQVVRFFAAGSRSPLGLVDPSAMRDVRR